MNKLNCLFVVVALLVGAVSAQVSTTELPVTTNVVPTTLTIATTTAPVITTATTTKGTTVSPSTTTAPTTSTTVATTFNVIGLYNISGSFNGTLNSSQNVDFGNLLLSKLKNLTGLSNFTDLVITESNGVIHFSFIFKGTAFGALTVATDLGNNFQLNLGGKTFTANSNSIHITPITTTVATTTIHATTTFGTTTAPVITTLPPVTTTTTRTIVTVTNPTGLAQYLAANFPLFFSLLKKFNFDSVLTSPSLASKDTLPGADAALIEAIKVGLFTVFPFPDTSVQNPSSLTFSDVARHILPIKYNFKALSRQSLVVDINGKLEHVSYNSNTGILKIENSRIIIKNVRFSNGIVHVVNKPISPIVRPTTTTTTTKKRTTTTTTKHRTKVYPTTTTTHKVYTTTARAPVYSTSKSVYTTKTTKPYTTTTTTTTKTKKPYTTTTTTTTTKTKKVYTTTTTTTTTKTKKVYTTTTTTTTTTKTKKVYTTTTAAKVYTTTTTAKVYTTARHY